ncbi:DUF3368 domain-containing protein [Spirulina sp. CS-785/01]|uniref:DUF3368 domain-containing protein n=1 Tax=Spirulina sp. CS-785/01 TaxID=3021716 RepID=UPI00232D11D2|nr:DUF3368 domain-containing protein [Spirulina sp. CS-785/01]MDB9311786.1 DUF3368 domain-containing protein [Spirulina sp. CS-785/01]
MIVVADTSPLCYLVLIGEINLLLSLFQEVTIPQAVFCELQAEGAPDEVRAWINEQPNWIKISTITPIEDPSLNSLHQGEREAIILAEEIKANLIILDEKAARTIAKERGLKVVGLLGILGQAAQQKIIDFPTAINRLQSTNFRIAPSLLTSLLDKYQNSSE